MSGGQVCGAPVGCRVGSWAPPWGLWPGLLWPLLHVGNISPLDPVPPPDPPALGKQSGVAQGQVGPPRTLSGAFPLPSVKLEKARQH